MFFGLFDDNCEKLSSDELNLAFLISGVRIQYSVESDDEITIIQNLMYLAKILGYVGAKSYEFQWYCRGPYSSKVPLVCFTLKQKLLDGVYGGLEQELDAEQNIILNRVRIAMCGGPDTVNRANWLVVITSIIFVQNVFDKKTSGRMLREHVCNYVFETVKNNGMQKNVIFDAYDYLAEIEIITYENIETDELRKCDNMSQKLNNSRWNVIDLGI